MNPGDYDLVERLENLIITGGWEIGDKDADALIQEAIDEIKRLRTQREAARTLIGAINDNAPEAVKASNINQAWHILNDNLRTPTLSGGSGETAA